MKRYLLTLTLVAIAFSGYAQSEFDKNIFIIKGGGAFAYGRFAETNVERNGSGFAQLGTFYAIEYNTFFHKNWGIGLTAGIRRNNFDMQKLADELVKDSPSLTAIVYADPYKTNFALLSGIYRVPASEKLSIYGKLSIGAALSNLPALYSIVNDGQNDVIFFRNELTETALAGGIALGFQYKFGKIGLGLEASTLNTTPKFNSNNTKNIQDMNTINTGLTLSYSI